MNPLDVVVVVALLAATIGGYQLGFAARLLAWLGVAVGLFLGAQFVARVVTAFGGDQPDGRVTIAALFLLLTASAGQGLGLMISRLVPREARPRARWDKVAGAGLGGVGVLVLVWLLTPSLIVTSGWPARAARSSAVVRWIHDVTPKPPSRFAALGRAVADAPYPSALGPFATPQNPGPVPQSTMPAAINARVEPSTVEVEGEACGRIQEGSGWVAQSGLVVTNAHVVAGEQRTSVLTIDGSARRATVVAFDPDADVAVLSVPEFDASPLPIASPTVGTVGAVYGHPRGGALQVIPARIAQDIVAVGTDIYRTSNTRRHVLVLATSLQPGDSGGALVDRNGRVVGMAFATDPGEPHTGYALTSQEVKAVLAARSTHAVDTGGCLVD
ncbi:MAG TPA: MarP family serine protease [Acidimicrobiia bacterium]|nr:MarP family serine protease [Acidimicrobiia bacterium]